MASHGESLGMKSATTISSISSGVLPMPWASARLLPLMLNGAPLPSPQSNASPCFARSSAHNLSGISETVILFGLARRTPHKSRKYHYFTVVQRSPMLCSAGRWHRRGVVAHAAQQLAADRGRAGQHVRVASGDVHRVRLPHPARLVCNSDALESARRRANKSRKCHSILQLK